MSMAEIVTIPSFFIFFLSLSAISISSGSTSSLLDVSASLDAATRAISHHSHPDPYQDTRKIPQTTSSSSTDQITLDIYSRDFLATPSHKDYRSLTLSRLRRDSARAEAIASNVISGTSRGSGEYLSRVGLGTPSQPQYMILDTGSDISWVQCKPCKDCYNQSDPVFDPSDSTSYSLLSCTSNRCRSLDVSGCRHSSTSCTYQVAYGDGSTTVGDFADETLTLGDSAPIPGVSIGCGHDNEGLFKGASGILGLGAGPLSFPSQISARSISYCLVNRDSPKASTLQLGLGLLNDSGRTTVTAPLLRNEKMSTFYYISMSGISVGGEMITTASMAVNGHDGSGGVILDTGTLVTRLRSEVYAAVRDAFARRTRDLVSVRGVQVFDTCYDLSSMRRKVVEVPAVSLHFAGGGEMKLPAKNYLIPVDSAGTFCLGFAPTNSSVSIVGNVQMQGTRVTIDRDSDTVRFALNSC